MEPLALSHTSYWITIYACISDYKTQNKQTLNFLPNEIINIDLTRVSTPLLEEVANKQNYFRVCLTSVKVIQCHGVHRKKRQIPGCFSFRQWKRWGFGQHCRSIELSIVDTSLVLRMHNIVSSQVTSKLQESCRGRQACITAEARHRLLTNNLINHGSPNHWEKIYPLVVLDIQSQVAEASPVLHTPSSRAPAARKSHIFYCSTRSARAAVSFIKNVLLDAIHAGTCASG